MTLAVNLAQGASNNVTFRNKIINGAMVISQRNGTSSVTINSAAWTYTVDRFCCLGQGSDGVYTVQQSSTAPTGFVNSLLVTVTTADASVGAGQIYTLRQTIEGYNVADLNWGTANAQSATLSFWVRSSVTGTFSGCFNNEGTASYPFTYTINSANTWEQKTVTVTGPTSGTWGSTNSNGIRLTWSLGTGSTYSGTANTWNYSTEYFAASSTTNLISTNGATFYITGVQLEAGTTASPFEYRQYTTELQLCQRYYQTIGAISAIGSFYSNTTVSGSFLFPVAMRSAPTVGQTGTLNFTDTSANYTQSSTGYASALTTSTEGYVTASNFTGITAYRPYWFSSYNSSNKLITLSAEL
jgi:hypothetical protein